MSTQVRNPNGVQTLQKANLLKLDKGDLLFKEGENSKAMYLLKSGMIRIFKNRGDSCIEIDTVRSGQILGELAFLDGNPRSASGEALTDCVLVEISGPTFQAVLGGIPDWLKGLLKTIVGRLRAASTRIRQLESASMAYDTDKDGKRSAQYIYMAPNEVLKLLAALLLVSSRSPVKNLAQGAEVRIGLLLRYANQVMGVAQAKIATFLDVTESIGLTSGAAGGQAATFFVRDMEFLERAITYLNEENLLEPSKRHDISPLGFRILELIARNMGKYPPDEKTGFCTVNVGEIKREEAMSGSLGKEPFRFEEFAELVKMGYATNLVIKSTEDAYTQVKRHEIEEAYRLQRVSISFRAINEQRRKGAA